MKKNWFLQSAIIVGGALLSLSARSGTTIQWASCFQELSPHFSCGKLPVPLNHNTIDSGLYYAPHNQTIETIDIALVKYSEPSSEPKQGSILFNPGGPGGSGVGFVSFLGPVFINEAVRQQYDLIGFDPRGTNNSNRLQCQDPTVDDLDALLSLEMFPLNFNDYLERMEKESRLVNTCAEKSNSIIHHMTTADVAKDMDYIRAALGDDELNYAGYSYGTYLGATYANLFPDRVGRMLLDSAIDPVAYATGHGIAAKTRSTFIRTGSHKGSSDTLAQFFILCDSEPDNCALAPDSDQRFDAIAKTLKNGPPLVIDSDEGALMLDYPLFVSLVLGQLYNSAGWEELAEELALLESLLFNNASLNTVETETQSSRLSENGLFFGGLSTVAEHHPVTYLEGVLGNLCTDTDNPAQGLSWLLSGFIEDSKYPYFGSRWAWYTSFCRQWPGSKEGRYVGPFHQHTKNPLLIIGITHDPATPYNGAVALNKNLPDSHLLTLDGWGHGSLFMSACIDSAISDYFLYGILPSANSHCSPDVVPFADSGHSTRRLTPLSESVLDNERLEQRILREQALRYIKPGLE